MEKETPREENITNNIEDKSTKYSAPSSNDSCTTQVTLNEQLSTTNQKLHNNESHIKKTFKKRNFLKTVTTTSIPYKDD